MKIKLFNREYEMREDTPGVMRLVAVDQYGQIVDVLEVTVRSIKQELGEYAEQIVNNYIGSQAHLIQVLEDYGWEQTEQSNLFLKRVIRVREYIQLDGVDWTHWVDYNDPEQNKTGSGVVALRRFLNKP
jgi:hypothetical protein